MNFLDGTVFVRPAHSLAHESKACRVFSQTFVTPGTSTSQEHVANYTRQTRSLHESLQLQQAATTNAGRFGISRHGRAGWRRKGAFDENSPKRALVHPKRAPDTVPSLKKSVRSCNPKLCPFREAVQEEAAALSVITIESSEIDTASQSIKRIHLFDMDTDCLPLIYQYLHDCELLALSGTCKSLYRATYPEFKFRCNRIISFNPVDYTKPRATVVLEHAKEEQRARADLAMFVWRMDEKAGYPKTTWSLRLTWSG